MANNFINRCATATRESVIIKRRGVSIMFNNVLMNNSVNFLCCYTDFNSSMTCIESISSYRIDIFNQSNVFRTIERDDLIPDLLLLEIRLSTIGIIWFLNVIRNLSSACKTMREWSKWA
jgi:hypothetical protein